MEERQKERRMKEKIKERKRKGRTKEKKKCKDKVVLVRTTKAYWGEEV